MNSVVAFFFNTSTFGAGQPVPFVRLARLRGETVGDANGAGWPGLLVQPRERKRAPIGFPLRSLTPVKKAGGFDPKRIRIGRGLPAQWNAQVVGTREGRGPAPVVAAVWLPRPAREGARANAAGRALGSSPLPFIERKPGHQASGGRASGLRPAGPDRCNQNNPTEKTKQ